MSSSCIGADDDPIPTDFDVMDDCSGGETCTHTVMLTLSNGTERKTKRDARTIAVMLRKKGVMNEHFAPYVRVDVHSDAKRD